MKKIYLLFIFLISLTTYSEISKKILTSNQVSYTLAKSITKDTDLEVVSAVDSYTDMFKQKNTFKNLDNIDEVFSNVGVVISFTKLLEDDFIYEQARRYNIGVIDIDLSYSYQENTELVLAKKVSENGKNLEYVWLDFSNIYKMAEILKMDLSRIYPENKEKFEKNYEDLRIELSNIYDDFINKIVSSDKDMGLIQIGDSELDYFLDSLEIYHFNIPMDVNIEELKKVIKETGISTFVSSKTISKNMMEDLKNLGAKYVKLDIASIPLDEDEDDNMDDDGFIKILKNNLEKLENILLK